MRGTKAKRLRREIYGDFSIREPRKYQLVQRKIGHVIKAVGRRRAYQAAKNRPGRHTCSRTR